MLRERVSVDQEASTGRRLDPAPASTVRALAAAPGPARDLVPAERAAGNHAVAELGHRLSSLTMRMDNAGEMMSRAAGAAGARSPERSAPKTLSNVRFPGTPVPAQIQRNGGALPDIYIKQLRAKQLYSQFVRNAARYGLPTKLLERVGRDYISSSAANPRSTPG